MSELDQSVAEVCSAGLIRRRRFRGGHRVTLKGNRYLRDAILRDEELRAEMSKRIDRWESGAMTKAERREALVELVVLGWTRDRKGEAEAVADLRAQALDPYRALDPREGQR
jgi:hypothetical protein